MLSVLALLLGVAYGVHAPVSTWDVEFTSIQYYALDAKQLFHDWARDNNRDYLTLQEEMYRYDVWSKAMEYIIESNDQNLTYKLRMNEFGDLTEDEFKITIHGHVGSCLQIPVLEELVRSNDDFIHEMIVDVPTSVDWQASGDVTPVEMQGGCGSCWAFASTGALECDYSIKKGKLTSLSEQQLLDCTLSYGNQGCNGGWWFNSFKYVIAEGGLCSESEYPYNASVGICRDTACGTKYDQISGSVKVTPDNDAALGAAVAVGCTAVGVDAGSAFQHYSSGIFTGECGTSIDHGVLIVGYGTSGSQQYWKVKNSWGPTWGDKGYIYICRNCDKNGNKGECGINMYPAYTTPQ